jgi:hypothetical protein
VTVKEPYAADCFRMHFGSGDCKATFDFDASRPNLPVVEVHVGRYDGVLTPQDALCLGEALIKWARQYGGESP